MQIKIRDPKNQKNRLNIDSGETWNKGPGSVIELFALTFI